jgi:hypothetical protein
MMLMILLTELARLEVHLSAASDGLHVQSPFGALSDELRLAMTTGEGLGFCNNVP